MQTYDRLTREPNQNAGEAAYPIQQPYIWWHLQRGHSSSHPYMQSKTSGVTWPGNLVHTLTWFIFPNNNLYGPWVPSCCSSKTVKLLHSPINYWIQHPVSTISKPDQRIQAILEPILQPHLGREPSQQSFPVVLSEWHPTPSLSSELEQLPHPKIDHHSRSHLPKGIISRHARKPTLSWLVKDYLCQSKPIKLGEEPYYWKVQRPT